MKRDAMPAMRSVGVVLFVILFVTTTLLSSVLGLTSYSAAKGMITEEVAAASVQAAVQASDKLDFWLGQYESLSRQYAVDQALKADLELINDPQTGTVERTAAEDRIRRKLDAVTGSDARLMGIRLLSKSLVDGESYRSSGVTGVRSDEGIQERVERILSAGGNPVWFPLMPKGFFEAYGEPSLTMGRLLRNMNHPEAEYIMLIEIKGTSVTGILSNLRIGLGGEVRLLDGSGQIAYTADSELLGRPSYIVPPLLADFGNIAGDSGEPDNGYSFTAPDENGDLQLAVYRPLAVSGWTMLGYAPLTDFTKSADRLLYITLAGVLAAAVLAALTGLFLVFRIGRPLGLLARLMEEGERGNLQVRTAFRRRDEIGRLGHSFNRMMEQLSQLVARSGASAGSVLETSGKLVEASRRTSLSARQVAAATGEIAAGAASLEAKAADGQGGVAEIGRKMAEVAEGNGKMNEAALGVLAVTAQGASLMGELEGRNEQALTMMNRMEDNAGRLRDSLVLIRSILDPLVALNKQTNILALNASIEASRAGEAGKGFVVIAGEIRRLAGESGQSLQSVARIAGEIGFEIEQTVQLALESTPLFREQITAVKESSVLFGEVKEEMERFTVHLRDSSASIAELLGFQRLLGEAMESVGSVVQQTGTATQEVAAMSSEQLDVSKELEALSDKLEELAESLKESLVLFTV